MCVTIEKLSKYDSIIFACLFGLSILQTILGFISFFILNIFHTIHFDHEMGEICGTGKNLIKNVFFNIQ